MIDIDTYQRRIGGFNNNLYSKGKKKKNGRRKKSPLKTIYLLQMVICITAKTVDMFSTTLYHTNTPRVFHVETTWKRQYNTHVEYRTWNTHGMFVG